MEQKQLEHSHSAANSEINWFQKVKIPARRREFGRIWLDVGRKNAASEKEELRAAFPLGFL